MPAIICKINRVLCRYMKLSVTAALLASGCAANKPQEKPAGVTTPAVTTTAITTTSTPKDPFEERKLPKEKEAFFEGTFDSYDGFFDPYTIDAIVIEEEAKLNDITVLINKYYAIKEGWVPGDLVYINTNFERKSRLREEAAKAWDALNQAAKEAGLTLYARDGFRSESLQSTYFTNAYNRNKGTASKFNALPWRSEHQLGLALDVTDVNTTENSLRQNFIDTPHGIFLQEEGWKYGWIVRYTKEKEMITQYNAEPWHIRYVGIDLAKILFENHLTLEEYHGQVYE